MSGVEVAGLVVAICTFALPAAQELYRKWKSKRRERERRENEKLQQQIGNSGDVILQNYNDSVRRFGLSFARGDDQSCAVLLRQRKIIDQRLKDLIVAGAGYGDHNAFIHLIHPNHELIARLCGQVVSNTLTALTEQFRRQAQAAPIRAGLALLPAASSHRSSSFDIKGPYNCFTLPLKHVSKTTSCRRCNICGWTSTRIRPADVCSGGMYPQTKDGLILDWDCLRQKFHHVEVNGTDPTLKYRCFVCRTGRIMAIDSLVRHIRRKHECQEICDGEYAEGSQLCGQVWRPGKVCVEIVRRRA